MNVRELREALEPFADDTVIEVATCWRKDEWYELYDVEADTNHRGEFVVVLNTD